MVTDQIEREITIDAPVDRVWSTLTTPEPLGKWFGDSGAEIDLKPGGSMVLHYKEYGAVIAKVEKVDPPHTFSYRWGNGPSVDPATNETTLVEFTLNPEGNGTRLHVIESGFSTLTDPNAQAIYDDHVGGWKSELNELVDYVQKVAA
jgi:uncharacterized protein YndB with AHSA1/START domain